MKTLQNFFLALALTAISFASSAQCNATFYSDSVSGGYSFWPAQPWFATYHWTFGDGDTSNVASPTHGYLTTGTYTVCLIGVDSAGTCRDTACQTIVVNPCQLTANTVTASFTDVNTGFSAAFTSTSGSPNPPLTYSWNFGNATPQFSTQPNPTTTFTLAGVDLHQTTAVGAYITLTVVDALGCSAQDNQNVSVTGNAPCAANISSTPAGPGAFTFADSTELPTGFNYQWSFGDGNNSTSANPTHTYTTNGDYNVCLTVTNTGQTCADTICTSLHAQVCGTVASFVDTISGLTADNITFTSTSTTNNPPLTYSWYFTASNPDAGTTPSITTVAQGNGVERATLMVTDATGCVDSTSAQIQYGQQSVNLSVQATGGGCPATFYLILEDTVGHLVLMDSTGGVSDSGSCNALNLSSQIPGTYFVKVALTTANTNYANYLPTYYNGAISWAAANPIYMVQGGYQATINMVQGVNPGGPGFIGGYVSEGAGLEAHQQQPGAVNESKALGDALAGVQINLTTGTGGAVAYTFTDANGHYQFANLAYGTYMVFTDVLNSKPSPIPVTLSAQNPTDSLANDSVQQSALTGIANINNFTLDRVYPNPVINNVTLAITSANETSATLKLIDMLGRTQLQKPVALTAGQNTFVVQMDALANGVYQLLLQTTTKTVAYKLVKVK